MISRDVRNTHPDCIIPIVPDCSCLDKRGMINKVIELNLQCFHFCVFKVLQCVSVCLYVCLSIHPVWFALSLF